MRKEHVAFIDSIARIQDWGRNIEAEDILQFLEKRKSVDREVAADPAKIAAWGIMELLRRLSGEQKNTSTRRSLTVSENALALPNASIGSFLYHYDIEDGLTRYIILATDDDGHCLVVPTDDFDLESPPQVRVAADYLHPNLREAMLAAIKTDREYHTPKLEFMEKLESAIASDGDLTPFFDGDN